MKTIVASLLVVAFMVALIPFIKNDYILSLVYLVVICASFLFRYERGEIILVIVGATIMFIFELLFISTGVETFNRTTLMGKMPVWLPILWGFGFVHIKRVVGALGYK
jgi:hypothetical protein